MHWHYYANPVPDKNELSWKENLLLERTYRIILNYT